MTDRTSPTELARAKWRSSGLTDATAKKLKLQALTAEQTQRLSKNFQPVVALKLTYFSLDGKPTKFFRIRYLEKLGGFGGSVAKPQRYAQPTGTMNEVYLPPILNKTWKEIADDPAITLHITEGELKSAAACQHGLATIGLGGVDVWRSGKRGLELLPQLAAFKWENREVIIIYDSDAATNPNVVRAQRQLARELLNRGALPSIASLPAGPGGDKQGLDDFLLSAGPDALHKTVDEAPRFAEAEALWELNEEVVYIKDPGLVVVREGGQRLSPNAFMQHAYVNRHYLEVKIKKDSTVAEKKPLAKRWIEWERRFELARITYVPGKLDIHNGEWNTWPGWGLEPKKGDIGPWKWLLTYLFQDESPDVAKWFERWCAYPLQHPGTKLFTSCLLWGTHQGTGKTLVAYTLMKIYGKNSVEIKDKDLRANFNEWAENKQFIYGDEVTGKDGFVKRADADLLKGLITQSQLRVNAKYLPSYTVPDCVNYYFTSNHPDAFFLEDNDRRFFIHEVRRAPAAGEYYKEYDKWLHGDGPSHLFAHLLNLDLGDFEPKAPALATKSKKNMIVDNKSDIGLWCVNLRENPEETLRVMGDTLAKNAELLTAQQLLRAYDPENATKVKVNGLARELKRSGFIQANDGVPVKTETVGLQRLYVVRNPDKWRAAKPKDMSKHFDDLMKGKF